jgi:PleD family two-component response regulator
MELSKDLNILIVDDSPSVIQALEEILVSVGFKNIVSFNSPVACEEKLPDLKPDIVFCDYHMDGMSGLEFFKKNKKFFEASEVVFLLITSSSDLKIVSSFLKEGVSQFIIKPLEKNNVIERLEMACSKKTK